MSAELHGWADRLENAIAREGVRLVSRVMVIAETDSTQDVARAHAGAAGGLMVIAGRQRAGRGRLGRAWVQRGDHGIAATFAIAGAGLDPAQVSLAAGVAAAEAIEASLPPGAPPPGLRWPNDVVERGAGRKLAGVLVERCEQLLLIGVGINVSQRPSDWPEELRGSAVSIAALGGRAERIDVAERLLQALDRALRDDPASLRDRWLARDVLTGTRATFVCGGRVVSGLVESIDPTHEIVLSSDGVPTRLPALTTTGVR